MPFNLQLSSQESTEPLYRQITKAIQEAILSRRLNVGERLPSVRELSELLNVSRATVSRSYEDLVSQGFIETITGSGTFVCHKAAAASLNKMHKPTVSAELRLSQFAQRLGLAQVRSELFKALHYSAPAQHELPLTRWHELLNRCTRDQEAIFSYVSDEFGYLPLREALCGYLSRFAMVQCSPQNIAVTSSTETGLDGVCRLLLDEGDIVAVEDPGFTGARATFMLHGAQILAIPVDEEGISVSILRERGEQVKVVYVTPVHDPTGIVMSMDRRKELLAWAKETNAIIVEDGFDSEFHFGAKPHSSLFSMDKYGIVVYRSNFWRTLFPMVRMGFMVIPDRLVALVRKLRSFVDRDVPVLEQRALADLIAEGHFERHIKRSKAVYAKRRAALIHALTREFGKEIQIPTVSPGMNLCVTFSSRFSPQAIETSARQADLGLVGTTQHCIEEIRPNEFLIDFAHGQEEAFEAQVAHFARLLADATSEEAQI